MYAPDKVLTRPVDVILPPEGEGEWILETEQTAGKGGGANE